MAVNSFLTERVIQNRSCVILDLEGIADLIENRIVQK